MLTAVITLSIACTILLVMVAASFTALLERHKGEELIKDYLSRSWSKHELSIDRFRQWYLKEKKRADYHKDRCTELRKKLAKYKKNNGYN